ncbi:MAG: transporter substrate-binding protein [Cohnella sp.]|nr:transporter substrate-binding protein [Cohnella sp.]
MQRKFYSLISVMVLIVLLVSACGGKTNTGGAGNSATASSDPKASQSAAPSNSASATAAKTGNFALDYVPKKKDGFTIGFSNGYFGNTWRSQYVGGVKAVGDKFKKDGVLKDVIIQNTNGVPAQIAAVESFINSGVDAIVLNPVSSSALAPVVAKAVAKDILVIISDDPAEYPNTINVTGDNGAFWRIQAKWIAEQLGGKGNIVQITGIAGNSADQLRQKEAKAVLDKYPDIKVLGSAPGGWDPTKAQQAMSNFLSAYKNIDGVLEQDVMGNGVIQAYEAAKKPLPVMTGDYTFGFLRLWKNKYSDLNTMTVPYAPGVGANSLEVTVRLLQGYKLKPESLVANPLKPDLKNTIFSAAPFVVTKEAQPDAPWMKGEDSKIKAISLDEALKIGEGQPDSASLDSYWTEDQLDQLFIKP